MTTQAKAARWLRWATWWNRLAERSPIFVWRVPSWISALCCWRAGHWIRRGELELSTSSRASRA